MKSQKQQGMESNHCLNLISKHSKGEEYLSRLTDCPVVSTMFTIPTSEDIGRSIYRNSYENIVCS